MTTPVATSRSTYTGNAVTTVFSTGFYFLDEAHVVVKLTLSGGSEIVQTLGVHYTIAMPASVGAAGSVTMLTAPANASSLVIERTVPYTQETSFRTQGAFSPATHEDVNDYSRHVDQQLARRVSDLESAGAVGSVVAGNGLAFSGTTLHVGAGAGIQSNADTVEVLFGAVVNMVNVESDASTKDAGVANLAARIDHRHNAETEAPAAGSVAIGNSAGAGASIALARADHVHPVTAPAAPADVTKAAASAGVATTFARADHKHDVTTAAAIDLTDATNAEGAATTLARSNHTHAHGARGGGTLHAAATNAVAGFQSAADKASMEAIGTVAIKSHVHAYQAAAQSMPNGIHGTTAIFETEDYDADAEYDPATGIYTAKAAGYLLVEINYALASAVWTTPNAAALHLVRNRAGDIVEAMAYDIVDANITKPIYLHISKVVKVAIGDTVRALMGHSQGGAVNSLGVRASCSITIDRII